MLFVAPSDEAHAVLVWENCAPHWTWKAEIEARNGAAKGKNQAAKGKKQDPKDPNQDPKGKNQEGPTDNVLGPTDKDKEDARSVPKHTLPNGGVKEWGGWKREARSHYRALLKEIKASKGDPNVKSGPKKKQFDYVKALELATLKKVQDDNAVKLTGRAAKRNPAANRDEEVDSDHEIDWD